MSAQKVRRLSKICAALAAKLNSTEYALAAAVRDLAEAERVFSGLCAEHAVKPEMDDPAFAAFTERRRALIRERLAALQSTIAMLIEKKEMRRREVESVLRQKIAVESARDALMVERKRELARRA
ncbi:MAG: hypothetical protein ACOZAA_14185 [Pseudomonadota bacterium]